MKKKIVLLVMLIFAALLFAGCAPLTVAEMYAIPKRSEEYSHLQSAIDMAMVGLSYSAPVSGDNQQTVQMADLDGDGVEEYLIFAKGNSDKPMQILIFSQTEDGAIQILSVIESNGFAFDRVEYVEIDHTPGCEIVVGRQVSDQLMGSVSVYTFRNAQPTQIMSSGYSRFLTCDIDQDDKEELVVIQHGESESGGAVAAMYNYRGGSMERSLEVPLSRQVQDIRRITFNRLEDGVPAVYVSSTVDDGTLITDILCMKRGKFVGLITQDESVTLVQNLRNYYVYPDDVDSDGVLDLPKLIPMRPLSSDYNIERQYLVEWNSVNSMGESKHKLSTYHNYAGGWYLAIDTELAPRITVDQIGNTYIFNLWQEDFSSYHALYTVYVMTGSDRLTQASSDNRFPLFITDEVVYAARLDKTAGEYQISKNDLMSSFRLIHLDWRTGEA